MTSSQVKLMSANNRLKKVKKVDGHWCHNGCWQTAFRSWGAGVGFPFYCGLCDSHGFITSRRLNEAELSAMRLGGPMAVIELWQACAAGSVDGCP